MFSSEYTSEKLSKFSSSQIGDLGQSGGTLAWWKLWWDWGPLVQQQEQDCRTPQRVICQPFRSYRSESFHLLLSDCPHQSPQISTCKYRINRRISIRKCSFFSPFIWNRTPELKVRGKCEQDAGSAVALAWAQIIKALRPSVDQAAANPASLHWAGEPGVGQHLPPLASHFLHILSTSAAASWRQTC